MSFIYNLIPLFDSANNLFAPREECFFISRNFLYNYINMVYNNREKGLKMRRILSVFSG